MSLSMLFFEILKKGNNQKVLGEAICIREIRRDGEKKAGEQIA